MIDRNEPVVFAVTISCKIGDTDLLEKQIPNKQGLTTPNLTDH
jgi:hypothetical protein